MYFICLDICSRATNETIANLDSSMQEVYKSVCQTGSDTIKYNYNVGKPFLKALTIHVHTVNMQFAEGFRIWIFFQTTTPPLFFESCLLT